MLLLFLNKFCDIICTCVCVVSLLLECPRVLNCLDKANVLCFLKVLLVERAWSSCLIGHGCISDTEESTCVKNENNPNKRSSVGAYVGEMAFVELQKVALCSRNLACSVLSWTLLALNGAS